MHLSIPSTPLLQLASGELSKYAMDTMDLQEAGISKVPPRSAVEFESRFWESEQGQAQQRALAAPPKGWKADDYEVRDRQNVKEGEGGKGGECFLLDIISDLCYFYILLHNFPPIFLHSTSPSGIR